jgi:hypothetical protein
MTASYPGGRQEVLLNVPAYSFNWQLFYYPKTPLMLPKGTRIDLVAHYDNSSGNPHNPDPTKTVTFGESSTSEMMFGMFEFTAVDGVSPKPGSAASRMDALMSSFPKGTAYTIQVPQNAQMIPAVLHLPKSGEAAWYMPTRGVIDVTRIDDLVWNGDAFKFSVVARLGPAPIPLIVTGDVKDGTIHGSLASTQAGPLPPAEFSGSQN